jgi:hypothetical protein
MWKCWEILGRWAVCGRTQASGSLLVGTVNLIFRYYWTARTLEGIRGREIRFWVLRVQKQSKTSEATFWPLLHGWQPACMSSTGVASKHSPLCSQSTILPVVPDTGPVNSCALNALSLFSSSRPNEIADPAGTPPAHVQVRRIYLLDSARCSLSRTIPHFVTLLPRACACDV